MAQDNKITMPSGQGGLTRYFEETNAKIELSPASIIIISIVIVIIISALHVFGGNLFQ
jgi:preprotein translocase subunit Sec61beta